MAIEDDILALLVIVDGKIDTLQADVDAIKANTDQISFISGDVVATLDGEIVNSTGSSSVLSGSLFEPFAESEY